MGTGFPGGTYPQLFYVADVAGEGPPFNGDLNRDLDESDFLAIFPLADKSRVHLIGAIKSSHGTVKTMVVQVGWPGATVGDTIEQITDRLERKLQETPSLDNLKSYTTPGKATIFVYLKDSTPAGSGAGHLVSGAQESLRHPQHLAAKHRRA
jgi:hypothetical protein